MIFHKNKLFGFSQLLFLCFQRPCCISIEFHIRILVNRITGAPSQISGLSGQCAVSHFQLIHNLLILWQQMCISCMHFIKPLPHTSQRSGPAKHQIQTGSHDRKHQNQNNPGYLVGRIDLKPIYTEYQQQSKNTRQSRNRCIIIGQPHCQPNDPYYLQQDTDHHHNQPPDTVFCIFFCFLCLSLSVLHITPLYFLLRSQSVIKQKTLLPSYRCKRHIGLFHFS